MITLRKTNIRKTAFLIAGLLLFVLLLTLSPNFSVQAIDTCGNGVCDRSENSDSCLQDCNCVDNGVVDPGEGCSCKDVVCEGEDLVTACGTHCGPNGECPAGLICAAGDVCWDAAACASLKPEDTPSKHDDDEGGGGCTLLPDDAPCEDGSECCSGVCDGVCLTPL